MLEATDRKHNHNILKCCRDRHEHAHPSIPRHCLQLMMVPERQSRPRDHYLLGRCNLTQSVKPLVIKQAAYLRVPKDVAELLDIMAPEPQSQGRIKNNWNSIVDSRRPAVE